MRYISLGLMLVILSLGVKAADVPPEEMDRLHHEAKSAFFAADYAAALKKWQAALQYARTLDRKADISKFLVNLAAVNHSLGHYQKALEYYQQAVVIDHELGDKKGESADLSQLALIHYNLGEYRNALSEYQQALEIQEEIEDRNGASNSLADLGMVFDSLGQYRKALLYYQQALEIKKEIGAAPADIANILSNIGSAHKNLSDYPNALTHFQQAIEIQEKIGNQKGIGNNLTNLGTTYSSLGEYPKALKYFRQALQKLGDMDDFRGVANIYSNMGVVYDKQGQYAKALTHLKQALQMQRDINDLFGIGNNLSNLGIVYRNLGDFSKALAHYQQALDIQIDIGDRRGEANTFSNLGVVYENLGQYPKALAYYQQALEIQRQIGDQQRMGNTLSNIGVLYYHLRHFEKARGYFIQALTIRDDIGDKWGKGVDLVHLGAAYYRQKDSKPLKALKYYQKALRIKRQLGDKRGESAVLSSIGSVYASSLNQDQQALTYFQLALMMDRELGDKIWEAADSSNLGRIYYKLGIHERARTVLQDSVTTLEKLGSSHLWYAQRAIAAFEAQLNENDAAVTHYEQAIENIEKLWIQASLTGKADKLSVEADKLSFMGDKFEVYDDFISLLQFLHQKYPKKGYDRKALEIFERKQGRVLLREIGKSGAQRFAHLPEGIIQQEQSLIKNIAKIEAQIVSARNKPFVEQDSHHINSLIQHATALNTQQKALQADILEKYPAYYALKYPQPATVAMLQNDVLKTGEFILIYGLMKEKTVLWVIGTHQFAMLTLPVGVAELNEDVAYLRDVILNRLPELADEAYPLYQKLIPFAARKLLADAHTLYIVPTEPLYMLPFETLITDGTNDSPRYLIQDYAIVYLSSASLLKILRDTRAQRKIQPRKKLLAFADPAYMPCDAMGQERSKFMRARAATQVRDKVYRERMGAVCFPQLPETAEEANSIATFFTSNENTLYLGELANRNTVLNLNKKGQMNDYRYVLFAVHGLLPNQVTGLTQSSLVLSNIQSDGYLTMADAFTLQLNADFINLSACNTGGGENIKGEGIMGLTRAFMYAGTSAIGVTLWSVESSSAKNLSVGIFENLKNGESAANAIRQIKLKMIAGQAKQPHYRKPFYWAPFVVYGNGS
jgi:tetratricopeptide (TPR) repeat protein